MILDILPGVIVGKVMFENNLANDFLEPAPAWSAGHWIESGNLDRANCRSGLGFSILGAILTDLPWFPGGRLGLAFRWTWIAPTARLFRGCVSWLAGFHSYLER